MASWFQGTIGDRRDILEGDDFRNRLVARVETPELADQIVAEHNAAVKAALLPAIPSRRLFLSQAAGLAAGGTTALALATVSATADAAANDSALSKLEEEIFEQYEAAHAHDDEIYKVHEIWRDELIRQESEPISSPLTSKQRWDLVTAMPESKEHTRLVTLGRPFFDRMNALIEQMFAIPAHTAEGRRAKVSVLLSCVMGKEWCLIDKDTDYDVEMTRNLLVEFIGGKPAEQLRDQFSVLS